jgi:N6-adenosine-specific RNA methylase IME4
MSKLISIPNNKKIDVLLADPPWKTTAGGKRNTKHKYKQMSNSDIQKYLITTGIYHQLSKNCLLVLWRLACMQFEAIMVCSHWSFTPKAEIIWRKQTVKGKRYFGMGSYVRAEHETAIIATRGSVKVADKSIRSIFDAKYRGPSVKPDEIYEIIERLVPNGTYCELFARRRREGWIQYGDELE